jgi:hypothetical protein
VADSELRFDGVGNGTSGLHRHEPIVRSPYGFFEMVLQFGVRHRGERTGGAVLEQELRALLGLLYELVECAGRVECAECL